MQKPPKPPVPRAQPQSALRIRTLLHTMRVVQQHEDEFCTMMHAIERAGKLSAAESRELHLLLDQMPGEALQHDLDAVRAALRPRPARPAKAQPELSTHAH